VYYETRIMFLSDEPSLRPGMTANVRIETGSSTATLVVPASALSFSATGTTARVAVGKEAQTRVVITGMRSQSGMVEILSGLSEGERVVLGEK
jgi:multidrug efflux pump subunit AcrA (membrane-fusion protein)